VVIDATTLDIHHFCRSDVVVNESVDGGTMDVQYSACDKAEAAPQQKKVSSKVKPTKVRMVQSVAKSG
jgi:hypothetical protein